MYSPRVGRFFAVDPLTVKYPWNSSYAFSENRVINAVELEGLEASYTVSHLKNGTILYEITIDINIIDATQMPRIHNLKNIVQFSSSQAEFSFSLYDGNITYLTTINYQIEGRDPKANNYVSRTYSLVMEYTDQVIDKSTGIPQSRTTTGRTGDSNGNDIGGTQTNVFQVRSNMPISKTSRTFGHELGHVLGLRHPKNEIHNSKEQGSTLSITSAINSPNNLLRQSQWGSGTDITPQQMYKIITEISIDRNSYTVIKGDTLSGIAKRFNTTTEKLAKINKIEDVNKIQYGSEIKIK